MKKLIIWLALATLGLSANAAPLVTIGDEVDIFFKGSVLGQYNSNVFYSGHAPFKYEDYLAIMTVGAEVDYGRHHLVRANLKFYEDFYRYADLQRLNVNLSNVVFTAGYNGEKFRSDLDFAFNQRRQNDADVGFDPVHNISIPDLIRYDNITVSLQNSYIFSEKFSAELNFMYYSTDYKTYGELYSDQQMYAIPVSALYAVTEKINVGLTYQYRHTTFDGGNPLTALWYGNSRDDHFGGITVRGELAPKLMAIIYLGATYRQMQGGLIADEGKLQFTGSIDLRYALTNKISTFINAYRDFGSGAARQNLMTTGVDTGAEYAYNEFFKFTVAGGYRNSDYQNWVSGSSVGGGRQDDNFYGRLGVRYTPSRYISMSLGYRIICNSSNLSYATYNQHVVTIDFSVRY